MSTQRSVSLPMYVSNPQAVQSLWQLLTKRLAQTGVKGVPEALDWPQDYLAHWRDPQLLLSQTCGYPLTHALAGAVQLIGLFTYAVPGSEGIFCRSQLVARQEHVGRALADFRGLRAAFNSEDSQSGYNALRAAVAPLAVEGRFFAEVVQTGSHAASLAAVQQGRADLAAVDCVTYARLGRDMPQTVEGVCVVGQTQPYPGLPLVTGRDTSASERLAVQSALAALVRDPAAAPALDALGINGFQTPPHASYQVCVDMRLHAAAVGYPDLA